MMYVIHFGNGLSTYALRLNFGLFLPVRCTGKILVYIYISNNLILVSSNIYFCNSKMI